MPLAPVIRAFHAGPTGLVTVIALVLSTRVLPWPAALNLTLAVFFGQCFVGWTNDLIDESTDRAAGRRDKPLVAGGVSTRLLHRLWPTALTLALATSLLGPMGLSGTLLYAIGLASASAYNLGLKSTPLSFVPYAVSFGLLPVVIFRAAHRWPPTWLVLASIAFSCSFHFVNVIKDLDSDRALGLMGLPQRLGSRWSVVVAIALAAAGGVLALVR
jgi:4-hydroxybenzoate polyprenyltransferase